MYHETSLHDDTSPSPETKESGSDKFQVAIVGAGAAGLSCANLLVQQYGLQPEQLVILEARDRIGGRIWTSEQKRVNVATGKTESFPVDFGAAWVHGTGLEWQTPITKSTQEKAVPLANPMMDLLQKNTPDGQDLYETHLKPIVHGNPWMRPRTIVHATDQMVLFADGRQVEKESPSVKHALERHFAILRKVSLLGDALFEEGKGMDTVSQSFQDTIARVVELEEFQQISRDLSTEEQAFVKLLTPFYQHMIECWYGSPASELQLCEFTEDYDGNDGDANYTEEGDFYGPHCTLKQGMKAVIEPLLGNGVESRVRLGEEVVRMTNLEPGTAGVRIQTLSGSDVYASCCVVTMPAGCLKEAIGHKQLFEPALSLEKIEAVQNTKMGCYKKVFLTFDRIFWPASEAFIGMVRGKPENHEEEPLGNYLLFDNLWSRDGIPCIEAVLFGSPAKWATHRSTDDVRDAVLGFMKDSMGLADDFMSFCVDCHVTRWEEDPYSLGAYSSMQLGAVTRHVDELRRPEWGGRLVFCGEATISSYEGSVYASLFSAENAASDINSFLNSREMRTS